MGGRRTDTFVRAYNEQALARVRAHLEGFSEAQLQRASARSTIAVVRKVQPIAKRDIRERYGVKATALDGKFKTVEGKGRKGDPYIGVQASSRQISLIDFGGRWTKRTKVGATAEIQSGQRKTYASAFISTVQGLRAIRVRRYINGPGKRYPRGPLRILRGPSPFEMLLGENMLNGRAISGKLLDVYQAEIQRQLKLIRDKKA